jgi:hypothetical protein
MAMRTVAFAVPGKGEVLRGLDKNLHRLFYIVAESGVLLASLGNNWATFTAS